MIPVLSLHQPYASLVAHGIKIFETRGQPLNGNMRPDGVRGLPGVRVNSGDRIAIAATLKPLPNEDVGRCWMWPSDDGINLPLGAILCTVRVDDCIQIVANGGTLPHISTWQDGLKLWSKKDPVPDDEWECSLDSVDISDQLPYGNWTPGGWAYQLADPLILPEAIPVKGKQGVWTWDGTL